MSALLLVKGRLAAVRRHAMFPISSILLDASFLVNYLVYSFDVHTQFVKTRVTLKR